MTQDTTQDGGVLQAMDTLLEAAKRFGEADARRRAMKADPFNIGVRVHDEIWGRYGTVESRLDVELPMWPVGVRWEDGSFEPCSVTELRVVEAVIA